MGRPVIVFTALLAAGAAMQPAAAQTGQAPWTANAVVPVAPPAPIGFVVAQGVTFVPQAFSETGYDTNPNQAFYGQQGSAFTRSGVGFSLSSVNPATVASLSATGSMLNYFNGADFPEPLRFSGSANASVTQLVRPGVTLSSGAFVNYDGQSINENQSAGANLELAYRDPLVSSVLRGRVTGVRYLDNSGLIATPVALTSPFNYNRSEVVLLGLLGNSWRLAPYAEVSAARVDYTDQPVPALVNRSADDYFAKGGVRWTASPVLSADIGWRFNMRDTEDRRIRSFNSNFFDGGLTWRPSPAFFFRAYVERTIGEPSTDFAILADVRTYNVKATYLPAPGVTVTAGGGWQVVNDIGSGVHYQAPFVDALVSWDYNNHVQFYTSARYQGYEIDWRNVAYDEFRIATGVRIVPDGQDLLNGEGLDRLFARLQNSRWLAQSVLSVSGGYSWIGLPDMKMATIVGGPFFDRAAGQVKTGGGSMDGWRTDVKLANFAEGSLYPGLPLSFGISGFFASYQNSTDSHCMYSLTTDCALVNIADFDSTGANNTGPFGNLHIGTDRNVNYYGVAIDARPGSWAPGGLKDGAPVQAQPPLKAGVAMRGIDQTAKLISVDPLVYDTVRYNESVSTHYWGGFVGFEEKRPLDYGWAVSADATAGVYYTDTQYQGRYNGYAPVGAVYLKDYGSVNASLDRGSFIGTLRLALGHELGWGTLELFGQGEYLSYVPRIAYNNNDKANPVTWPVNGAQAGTRIKSDDAFNYTTGLNVSFPMH